MHYKDYAPWRDTVQTVAFPSLENDISVDILVIGAGIAGVATTYVLSQENKSVALIEKETIGSGATGHTTAFLGRAIDTDLGALVEMYGKKGAKIVWESHQKAIELIGENVKKEKIDCEFTRCSYYEFALGQKDNASLEEETKLARKFGFSVEYHSDKKLGFNPAGYTEIKDQGKFHPLKYMTGLARAAQKNGVQIFEHTEAVDIEDGEPLLVKTTKGLIRAKQVIVTTYAPFVNRWEHFFKSAYYADFMMELELPKGSIKEALYADTSDPYTYFRIDPNDKFDRMIIGGLTHRVQVPMSDEKGYAALETWIQKLFPDLQYKITRKWSGRLIEPDDGIAYIGNLSGYEQVYVATGFSGNGMTYSHISAMIFKDLLKGKKNEWANFYNAQRIPTMKSLVQKGKDYTSTLIGGVKKNLSEDATK